jgi:hypothetical protein
MMQIAKSILICHTGFYKLQWRKNTQGREQQATGRGSQAATTRFAKSDTLDRSFSLSSQAALIEIDRLTGYHYRNTIPRPDHWLLSSASLIDSVRSESPHHTGSRQRQRH